MITKVFAYGLPLGATVNADVVAQQLRARHQYYNQRIELERHRRGAWEQANPVWMAATETLTQLDTQFKELKTALNKRRSKVGYQKHLIAEGKRTEPLTAEEKAANKFTADEQAQMRALKVARKQANATKKGKRPEPEVEAALKKAESTRKNELYRATSLYSASKDLVDDAFKQIRKTPNTEPKFKRWTAEGSLAVRFTAGGEGGISKGAIFSGEDTRIRITVVEDSSFRASRAIVQLRVASDKRRPVWATFPMVYHRPLPDDALIKMIKLVVYRRGTVMKYELQFTLQSETFEPAKRLHTGLSAGFDLGWRGGFRFGYLYDSDGGSFDMQLPKEVSERIQHAQKIRSTADNVFNENLAHLVTWLGTKPTIPEWFEKFLCSKDGKRSVHSWKSPGRLAGLVYKWSQNRFAGDEAIYSVMDVWRHRNRHLYQYWSNLDTKTRLRRKDFYLNTAKQMVLKYDTIYVEDLNGSDMAEDGVGGTTRMIVAPFEFRDALKKAAQKWNCQIVVVPAAYTSRTCFECGYNQPWINKAEQIHTCGGCSAVFDRDENAARNILRAGMPVEEIRAAA